jgi:hypothetical protein
MAFNESSNLSSAALVQNGSMCEACNLTEVHDIVFEALFHDRPIKTASVAVSVVGAVVCMPFVYGIIWFEENNHLRTLINQGSIQ